MTLEEITTEIEKDADARTLYPSRVADLIVLLGVKYSRAVDNYMVCKAEYAQEFSKRREEFKSDTSCERQLDYEEIGLKLSHWKYQTKKAEMLVNTLKGYLYQKNSEARNET